MKSKTAKSLAFKLLVGGLSLLVGALFAYVFWFYFIRETETHREQIVPEVKIEKKADRTFTVNGCTFTMKYVKGGDFMMGATAEQMQSWPDEKPAHHVIIDDYYIGETEVTQELYKAVMGENPSQFKGNDQCPVENVSWVDCQNFVEALNRETGEEFCLPTEAQWEYAARGGEHAESLIYSGGDDIDEVGWHKGNSGGKTHAVKTKRPNALGIYDMTGNVMEWCNDYFGKYSTATQENPTGPSYNYDEKHVIRSGAWCFAAKHCRLTNRSGDKEFSKSYCSGFRIAMQ